MRVATGSLLAWVALSTGLFAADERKAPPKLPAELEPVFGMALAAPPEFAAGALLRLTPRIADKELRRDFVEMAFRLGGKAQNPVQLVAVPGSEVDTRSGYLASALRLKMDKLSLQARAVQLMVGLDPVLARELFAQLSPPSPGAADCEDALLPDLSPYYDALAAITRGAFSDKERAKGEHLTFATAMLARVSSVAELAAAERTLLALDGSRQPFEIGMGAIAARFEALPADSRSFLYFSKSIEQGAAEIVARARQLGVNPDPFVQAYRKFLVNQLRGPRCADSGEPAKGVVQIAPPFELFGQTIRGDQPPIASDEMTPSHIEGNVKMESFWKSGEAQRIYTECLKLRQGPNGVAFTDSARRSSEWTRQFTDFLSSLSSWKPGDESSEADYYHQKALVYEALLELAPAGDLSDRVLETFVAFLKSSNMQRENAVEWFWHARSTVNRIRPSHPEQAAKLLAAYRASGNIILVLEAMLDPLAPLDLFATNQ